MQIVYLVLFATSTFFTSVALSLLLPFRFLFRRYLCPTTSAAIATEEPDSYYEGVRGTSFIFRRYLCPTKSVTNTPWGEKVYFECDPGSDLITKTLHVSPFMDMLGNWTMKVNSPGDDLSVSVVVQHPDLGTYFTATLRAKRITASMVLDPTLFFWLMPQKAAFWTYWQALKLWWKGVPFIEHPRYLNQAYKEEALLRDQILRCCKSDKSEFGVPCSKDDQQHAKARGFIWREAKWPWC